MQNISVNFRVAGTPTKIAVLTKNVSMCGIHGKESMAQMKLWQSQAYLVMH